ncbi:MAG: ASCH domain-containing protein [bacterium]
MHAMYALNFYSSLFADSLRQGVKTVSIRLGNKMDKYRDGQVVWITVGRRFGTRRKIFPAIIDRVEVKRLAEVTPREIERDNPQMRRHEDLIDFLSKIYNQPVTLDDEVSVIYFSRIEEGPPGADQQHSGGLG